MCRDETLCTSPSPHGKAIVLPSLPSSLFALRVFESLFAVVGEGLNSLTEQGAGATGILPELKVFTYVQPIRARQGTDRPSTRDPKAANNIPCRRTWVADACLSRWPNNGHPCSSEHGSPQESNRFGAIRKLSLSRCAYNGSFLCFVLDKHPLTSMESDPPNPNRNAPHLGRHERLVESRFMCLRTEELIEPPGAPTPMRRTRKPAVRKLECSHPQL